jgi:hypothetical protein
MFIVYDNSRDYIGWKLFFRPLSDQLTDSQYGYIVLCELIIDFMRENNDLFEISIDNEVFFFYLGRILFIEWVNVKHSLMKS